MSKSNLYIVFIIFILSFMGSNAQTDTPKGYRIEGDEIVFSFHRNEYKKATKEKTSKRIDFDDIDIENVVVSGNFNNWSMNDWYMKKIDADRYELRKKLSDFNDEFTWEFKFVVNNNYWAEPSKRDPNVIKALKNGLELNVYNLQMYTAFPNDSGNITFKLKGFKDAKNVVLSGSFNKWDEHLFRMKSTDFGFELTLQMKPGEYEYKYIVDGKWIEDPNNPSKRRNEYSGYNSVISILAPTTFILNGYENAKKVTLAGSFNDWNENAQEMSQSFTGWECGLLLPAGKHHYKYIVDGVWILDPDNPVREDDGKGNVNSVWMVK
ncbi:hypothetical protein [Ulvibacter antarcticus]|uniref:AMP-activated protein kinase-like protein n=1 Tax=Ulvibacter antarcticus TaxID=442714 RepID=A0A3L9YGS6_9FLAO|nr:hypothetical protein [Ulvibacter antarcticus]RMA58650.1 AMP-activated protein kinase-like protein [Ulvibacter antarcticus]